MKKYLLSLAVVLMGTATFTSCDDDDPSLRPLTPVLSSKGAYVGGDLKNLLNRQYEIVASYPMPGISWQMTIGYEF